MTLGQELVLAFRFLVRDLRAGELQVLALALAIGVAAVTTVGFFNDRVRAALVTQANRLLGADLVVTGDRPLPERFRQEAQALGLATVALIKFPSMAFAGEGSLLVDVRAVERGYPLRGELRVADAVGKPPASRSAPTPGSVWVDPRVLSRLGVAVGDRLGLGERSFTIGGVIDQEPESVAGFFNLGARVILNLEDLPSTGLIQPGSRIRYSLLVAGAPSAVEGFHRFATRLLGPGQKVDSIRDARPEIRSGLERAERFLALSSLAAVLLAAVAVALAARHYLQRHFDACAMMRCLGASQGSILRVYGGEFLLLGATAGAAGALLGWTGQGALLMLLAPVIGAELPPAGLAPLFEGYAAGFVLLLGFAMPPLAALARVPTLRVLRRELGMPGRAGVLGYALGIAAMASLILWQAGDWQLGRIVLLGTATGLLAAGALSWLLVRGLGALSGSGTGAWRMGLANLRRRPASTALQAAAMALGLMAMLLLTLVRDDLLQSWRSSLPPDAPNRFLVNIQPDQRQALARFFEERGLPPPKTYPMVRARLVAINGRPVSSADYADERAKRLIDREFNLSWAQTPQTDNRIVAGRWWTPADRGRAAFSVEQGIARTLGIRLGDTLTYDIAGATLSGPVTSLRSVEWDSFRVNFFVVTPPGVLDGYPTSDVASFHLPQGRSEVMDALVKRLPNLLVIDVAAVLAQVQALMDQVIRAVEFVFLFTLAAGVLVLYAALEATRDERLAEAALLRTLGAQSAQLRAIHLVEFALIGLVAGSVAAAGATAVGWAVSTRVLNIPFQVNEVLWIMGILAGTVGVALAGWLGTRRVATQPPLQVLNATA
ncbi:ABC transporter permease [Pelomicrobium sp.]|jgi:putative ABC transport system permease protein|uniref:ABC transporter permease n=1 Tax=Pelomicrobium sp. TaxID=2815319 RepID=UPI002FDD97F4